MAEYKERVNYCKNICLCSEDLCEKEKCPIWRASTADVEPVRHGHWIINSDGYYPQCSECMSEPRGRKMTKYCGECGAKMDNKE